MSFFTGARTFQRLPFSTEETIKGLEPLRSAFERKKKEAVNPYVQQIRTIRKEENSLIEDIRTALNIDICKGWLRRNSEA